MWPTVKMSLTPLESLIPDFALMVTPEVVCRGHVGLVAQFPFYSLGVRSGPASFSPERGAGQTL